MLLLVQTVHQSTTFLKIVKNVNILEFHNYLLFEISAIRVKYIQVQSTDNQTCLVSSGLITREIAL